MLDLNAALFGTVRRMHDVQRYSSLSLNRHENVAEHSWQVAALSLLICDDLKERHDELRDRDVLDSGIVLERAIWHDISESLSGDIIRAFKHSSPEIRKAINDADELNMDKLVRELGEGYATRRMQHNWVSAKDADIEGQIVAFADMLTVISFCVNEWLTGNNKLLRLVRHLYEHDMQRYYDERYFQPYMKQVFPWDGWEDAFSPEHAWIGSSQKERT